MGDANFQQKCLQRIGEIVRSGTTLLYVSHDLASVEASCEKAVWLADAVVQASGPTQEVVAKYRAAVEQNAALVTSTEGVVQVLKAEIEAADGGQIRSEVDLDVRLTLNSPKPLDANFFIGVSQGSAFPMFIVRYSGSFPAGDFEVTCRLHHVPLPKGRYSLWPAMSGHAGGKGKPLSAVAAGDVLRPDGPRAVEPARGCHGRFADLRGRRLGGRLTSRPRWGSGKRSARGARGRRLAR